MPPFYRVQTLYSTPPSLELAAWSQNLYFVWLPSCGRCDSVVSRTQLELASAPREPRSSPFVRRSGPILGPTNLLCERKFKVGCMAMI
ncbi:hypothetical protein FOMPIDRAFT_1024501 [Fomitopsis schrenkii]|uniref:Uncharacterized protein n=1 Tax=Fomitopsis schrenkii TaxID=2126942 RepID=S8E5X8_FOMSC|nr:hypothetical protein FOMPIDRAFT_1024501 [Fomitopsis schrenkii]